MAGDHEALAAILAPPELDSVVRAHRIVPSLAVRAAEHGLAGAMVEAWQVELCRVAGAHLVLASARDRLAEVLGRAGVPWAPLKGMALAGTVYPRPEERPSGDIDLLVDPSSLRALATTRRSESPSSLLIAAKAICSTTSHSLRSSQFRSCVVRGLPARSLGSGSPFRRRIESWQSISRSQARHPSTKPA